MTVLVQPIVRDVEIRCGGLAGSINYTGPIIVE